MLDASFFSLSAMRALEVALECHATLPDGWRDDDAANSWQKVLAAIHLPTTAGKIILPFAGADKDSATPKTWSLGNLQQLLVSRLLKMTYPHGLPRSRY